jgi:hypothetical protein
MPVFPRPSEANDEAEYRTTIRQWLKALSRNEPARDRITWLYIHCKAWASRSDHPARLIRIGRDGRLEEPENDLIVQLVRGCVEPIVEELSDATVDEAIATDIWNEAVARGEDPRMNGWAGLTMILGLPDDWTPRK